MLACFQLMVRNHQWQERVSMDSYSISSHSTKNHMSTPTCTLTYSQLAVVSQELQLCQPFYKHDALSSSAIFISLLSMGWSKVTTHPVISGSFMQEQCTMESAFIRAGTECDNTMCLNLYLCPETPDHMGQANFSMQSP